MIAAAIRFLRGARQQGVTKTVTPQPNPVALNIEAALEARRRARTSRSEAAAAGHATRRAHRLPDPILMTRGN